LGGGEGALAIQLERIHHHLVAQYHEAPEPHRAEIQGVCELEAARVAGV